MHLSSLQPRQLVLGRRDARGSSPIAPAPVLQVPAARCDVGIRPGYYSVVLHLDAHRPAHDALVAALTEVEDALAETAGLDPAALKRVVFDRKIYMSVRDDTEWFDADGSNIRGSIDTFPVDFKEISALLEIPCVWSKDGRWGVRLKMLQAKRASVSRLRAAPPLFLEDPEDSTPMFLDD